MKKRVNVSARVRKLKQEIARKVAKNMRASQRVNLKALMERGEVKNYDDVWILYKALSRRAKDNAVYQTIISWAGCGFGPAEIIKKMEPPKEKKEKAV